MRAIDAANWREPSTSSSPTSSPATAPRKNKQLTCWFWKKQGSCCWSAEECKFSHEDTGNMSFMPRQLRYTAAKRAKAERAAAETAEADEARDETAGGPSDGAVNRNEHPSDGNVDLISLHDNDSGDDFYNSFAHNHNSSDNDYNGFRHFRNAYVPPPARLPPQTCTYSARSTQTTSSSTASASASPSVSASLNWHNLRELDRLTRGSASDMPPRQPERKLVPSMSYSPLSSPAVQSPDQFKLLKGVRDGEPGAGVQKFEPDFGLAQYNSPAFEALKTEAATESAHKPDTNANAESNAVANAADHNGFASPASNDTPASAFFQWLHAESAPSQTIQLAKRAFSMHMPEDSSWSCDAALIAAVEAGDARLVTMLLQYGASPDAKKEQDDIGGEAVPALALALGQAPPAGEVFEALLESYADPRAIPAEEWATDGKPNCELYDDVPGPIIHENAPLLAWFTPRMKEALNPERRQQLLQAWHIGCLLSRSLGGTPVPPRDFSLEKLPIALPLTLINQDYAVAKAIELVSPFVLLPSATYQYRPLFLVFEGPPGVGKSALADMFGKVSRLQGRQLVQNHSEQDSSVDVTREWLKRGRPEVVMVDEWELDVAELIRRLDTPSQAKTVYVLTIARGPCLTPLADRCHGIITFNPAPFPPLQLNHYSLYILPGKFATRAFSTAQLHRHPRTRMTARILRALTSDIAANPVCVRGRRFVFAIGSHDHYSSPPSLSSPSPDPTPLTPNSDNTSDVWSVAAAVAGNTSSSSTPTNVGAVSAVLECVLGDPKSRMVVTVDSSARAVERAVRERILGDFLGVCLRGKKVDSGGIGGKGQSLESGSRLIRVTVGLRQGNLEWGVEEAV